VTNIIGEDEAALRQRRRVTVELAVATIDVNVIVVRARVHAWIAPFDARAIAVESVLSFAGHCGSPFRRRADRNAAEDCVA
jgi:hypothetical protein